MKYLFSTAALLCLLSFTTSAQIKSAKLTASGLTCSMCSKAIYKSLQKLSTIQDIKVDIQASSYVITFKEGAPVSLDAVKKAVEDAGFAVASLNVTASFPRLEIAPNLPFTYNGASYRFVNIERQTVEGERTFRVLDKGFLSAAEYKKVAKSIAPTSAASGRVYNITL